MKNNGAARRSAPLFFSFSSLLTLLRWRQKSLRRRQEFDLWKLSDDVDAYESSFLSAAAIEGHKILIVQMGANLVKIRLQRDGRARAKVIGFSAGLVRELAEVRLPSGDAEESARPVPVVGGINRPDVDVLLLGAFNRGTEIRASEAEIPAEIVDPRGDQQDGAPVLRRWQTLQEVLKREIGA